jgi:hypothetical protein
VHGVVLLISAENAGFSARVHSAFPRSLVKKPKKREKAETKKRILRHESKTLSPPSRGGGKRGNLRFLPL